MPPITRHSARPLPFPLLLFFAVAIYLALALLLAYPWPNAFNLRQFFPGFSSILGATGCFLLSRRWLASFNASAIAGAVYGFGPYFLSFQMYHPLAGLSIALLPWLFCPAALWQRHASSSPLRWLIRTVLLLLPFAGLVLYFWLPAQSWAGPYDLMPRTQQIQICDLPPLLGLPAQWGNRITIGLYPNAFILAVMGLFVYLAVLRISVLLPVLAAVVLACLQPLLNVPPVIWLAVPMLFFSVLAGLGAQAFAWAGASDRKWVWICMLLAIVLLGICLVKILLNQQTVGMFRLWAILYAAACLMTSVVFLLARRQIRWHLFRWILMTGAVGADLFLAGRLIATALS